MISNIQKINHVENQKKIRTLKISKCPFVNPRLIKKEQSNFYNNNNLMMMSLLLNNSLIKCSRDFINKNKKPLIGEVEELIHGGFIK